MGETAHSQQRAAIPATASLRVDPERIERMWAMRPDERIRAAREGQFTVGEMLRWASRRPSEVELVDGEFWFITAYLADAGVGVDRRWTKSTVVEHRVDNARDIWTIPRGHTRSAEFVHADCGWSVHLARAQGRCAWPPGRSIVHLSPARVSKFLRFLDGCRERMKLAKVEDNWPQ